MAQFNFQVDTTPMARKVETVQSHVNGVSAAVTAMESAVIAAEQEASKTICDNVDRGFYVLVKSQISQKAVAAYTEMTSKEIILFQLAKALDRVKLQMQADYTMISRRYFKLFNSLNKSLETRVKELDRPAMKIAEIKKSFVFDKLRDESSLVYSASNDTQGFVQTALTGKIKQKTLDTMRILHSTATETGLYNEKLESILEREESYSTGGGHEDEGGIYLPVLSFLTESLLNKDDLIENTYVPQFDAPQTMAPVIAELGRVGTSLSAARIDEEEKGKVRKEFLALCEKEDAEERLTREMIRLFDASSWEAFEK
ncbi:MAG: hypothetical protein LBF77_07580 [Spirochaetaceae bacterium]|jgi:hypothetical protein|nr:hypothetical protein [Spirochaetaceae bacterium]